MLHLTPPPQNKSRKKKTSGRSWKYWWPKKKEMFGRWHSRVYKTFDNYLEKAGKKILAWYSKQMPLVLMLRKKLST